MEITPSQSVSIVCNSSISSSNNINTVYASLFTTAFISGQNFIGIWLTNHRKNKADSAPV